MSPEKPVGDAPAQIRIGLKYPDVDTFVEKFAANVTKTGVFLASKTPKPVGTVVRFEIVLGDGTTKALRGEGTVTAVREADPSQPNRAPGMGVKLSKLDPESKKVVERILAFQEQAKQKKAAAAKDPAPEPRPQVAARPAQGAPVARAASGELEVRRAPAAKSGELQARGPTVSSGARAGELQARGPTVSSGEVVARAGELQARGPRVTAGEISPAGNTVEVRPESVAKSGELEIRRAPAAKSGELEAKQPKPRPGGKARAAVSRVVAAPGSNGTAAISDADIEALLTADVVALDPVLEHGRALARTLTLEGARELAELLGEPAEELEALARRYPALAVAEGVESASEAEEPEAEAEAEAEARTEAEAGAEMPPARVDLAPPRAPEPPVESLPPAVTLTEEPSAERSALGDEPAPPGADGQLMSAEPEAEPPLLEPSSSPDPAPEAIVDDDEDEAEIIVFEADAADEYEDETPFEHDEIDAFERLGGEGERPEAAPGERIPLVPEASVDVAAALDGGLNITDPDEPPRK